MSLQTEEKLSALGRIYEMYDQYTRKLSLACRKYCDHCCTCNVTATGLEALKIARSLSESRKKEVFRALYPSLAKKRYLPGTTLNQMAEMCARKEEPPDEEVNPDWGKCPLLTNRACPIYEVRPFGCRCLISTRDCSLAGCAEIDPFTLTVNYVFAQFIEHLDQGGVYGNLADVLCSELGSGAAVDPGQECGSCRPWLIENRPIPLLLIPPSHRQGIYPLVEKLRSIVSAA